MKPQTMRVCGAAAAVIDDPHPAHRTLTHHVVRKHHFGEFAVPDFVRVGKWQ